MLAYYVYAPALPRPNCLQQLRLMGKAPDQNVSSLFKFVQASEFFILPSTFLMGSCLV
ncbi:hypothetical protein CTQ56_000608 [Salmonella enterica subsp. houtenae]|uniref:Uncharacterized protein n=7 Tax=Salmonella houtenae TaxID=59205 RepID=A0A730K6Z2_SALHO|nr:hypothetical protein [Salmonella enterica]EDP9266299.1 hypothetical protein [Salmonella enterica subsp. houtenae]EDP9791619.1 hypothetical protein [Salmonella enterica subsp. salamae]EDQ4518428.1 hypothetical protein [Salmonella enterica subsp. enterica]EDS4969547.1 hypothetical protein [Salmonella enterica subsp. enterica serovar O rough]EDT6511156.1 hypothetical protein [Salmonella enterica subsp. enterica serovar Tallahassee]EDW4110968.1 hypothetical protein [Salmonella enterica subsp. 